MNKLDGYKQVDELRDGEIIIKFPGNNIILPYSEGKAFVNNGNDTLYNSLKVTDMYCESEGEVVGMFGDLGQMLAQQINSPEIRTQISDILKNNHPIHLFLSKTIGGLEILTVPNFSGETNVDSENIENMVLGSYSIEGIGQEFDSVRRLHSSITENQKLKCWDFELVNEDYSLVDKTNLVYQLFLELMKKF